MIIRATKKLLNISSIEPSQVEFESMNAFPGEWFANTLKTGISGRLIIHFFHKSTKISILCPSKSLRIAIPLLSERVLEFLKRHGFEHLWDKYDLNSEVRICPTNDRSTLASMNQLKKNIEWHFLIAEIIDNATLCNIEDVHSSYLFPTGKKLHDYETTVDILERIKHDN